MTTDAPQVASDDEDLSPRAGADSTPDGHFMGSIAWTAAAKWSAQVFAWICSLVTARLLSPADFGLLTMTTVFLGLSSLISEFGFTSAVINLPDLTRRQLSQLNTVALSLSVAAYAILCIASRPIAAFFRQPELILLFPVMGIGLFLAGLRAIPNALLQKGLRFRCLSVIEFLQAVTQAGITVLLAWIGLGYWALVVGILIGALVSTILTLSRQRAGFARPGFADLREVFRFSRAVLVSNACWYVYSNSDFTVAGRVLGRTALGAYSMAWNLAMLPGDKIASLIMRVTPGYLARHQTEPPLLRRYLRLITKGISVAVFPVAIGLALTARDLVPLVLGPQWAAASDPLALLSLYMVPAAISPILAQLVNAVGRPSAAMWNSILKLLALPPLFYLDSRWGPDGIALTWLLGCPLLTLPLLWSALRVVEMPLREYIDAIRPAVLSSLAMVATVWLVKPLLSTVPSPLVKLAFVVAAGSAAYSTVLLRLEAELAREVWGKIRCRLTQSITVS